MAEWLTKIVVALSGLAGTGIVAYIGYLQWKGGRRDLMGQDTIVAKRKAYETLWQLVEEIHVHLRTDQRSVQRLPKCMAELNAFIFKNEIYLDDDVHTLVNEYLKALKEMVTWAENEGDEVVNAAMYDTCDIPSEALAVARAFSLRDELKQHVRKALETS